MKKIILIFAVFIFAIPSSFALSNFGLFVEPMLTYEKGDADINFSEPLGDSDTDIDGFGLGGRLGVHFLESFFVALDGRYSMPNFDDGRTGIDTESTAWNYGPVAGIQLPWVVGLRVWGGYVMDGEVDPDKDNGINAKFEEGTGYRVGAGFKIAWASLNLEYQDITYEDTTVEQIGGFNSGASLSDTELENKSWVLSVSFPFSL